MVHFANGSFPNNQTMQDVEDHHTTQDHEMLRLMPNDFLTFTREADGTETNVEISSSSKFPITYKIQTTSPEKFRVRPRCGLLNPGETVSVCILLKPEHCLAEGSKDKFLVMCMPVPTDSLYSVQGQGCTELWKHKPTNLTDIEQHRLCCIYKNEREAAASSSNRAADDSNNKTNLSDITKLAEKLERNLKFTQTLQLVTIIFLLILSVAVVYLLKLQGMSISDDDAALAADSQRAGHSEQCNI